MTEAKVGEDTTGKPVYIASTQSDKLVSTFILMVPGAGIEPARP